MKKIQHIASALVLAAATAVGTAHANGNGKHDTFYPENPNPGHNSGKGKGHGHGHGHNHGTVTPPPVVVPPVVTSPVQNNPTFTNAPVITNAPVVNPSFENKPSFVNAPTNTLTANPEANAAAAAKATAEQQQQQQQWQQQEQLNQQTQDQSNQMANMQDNNMALNLQQKFEASKMANLGTISIIPAANCGTGWSAQLSVPNFASGLGKSDISKFCLSQDAASLIYKGGILTNDKGVQALALKAFTKMHPEFLGAAAKDMIPVLKSSCFKGAGDISVALLLDEDMKCDGEYVDGTREFAELAQARELERQKAVAGAVARARVVAEEQVRIRENVITYNEGARAATPAPRKERSGGQQAKAPCVTVEIPETKARTACVDPAVAKRNNWQLVPAQN